MSAMLCFFEIRIDPFSNRHRVMVISEGMPGRVSWRTELEHKLCELMEGGLLTGWEVELFPPHSGRESRPDIQPPARTSAEGP